MPRRKITSREQAEAYFDLWVHGGEAILEAFAQRMRAAGGPASALTFTPESLTQVFGWSAGKIRLVQGEVVDDGRMPPWHAAGPAAYTFGDFDAESARWADGLSRYFGEVLVRHLPGVRWAIADEPRRRAIYPDQWWPVIAGTLLTVNPLDAGGLAAKQGLLPPEQRDDGWLLRNYWSFLDVVTAQAATDDELDGWQVDKVDVAQFHLAGWRFGVSGPADVELDETRARELTLRLSLLPGVIEVDRDNRTSWLLRGDPDRAQLDALVRAWSREG